MRPGPDWTGGPERRRTRLMSHDAWKRALKGRSTLVLGGIPAPPEPSLGLRVLRTDCDGPSSTLGPLWDIQERVARQVGVSPVALEWARTRMASRLRHKALGEEALLDVETELVEVLNRLVRPEQAPSVLLVAGFDAADEATVDALTHILGTPGWLKLPVVLAARTRTLSGIHADLAERVREVWGDEAMRVEPLPGEGTAAPRAAHFDWRALPERELATLRMAALLGASFEVAPLATALRVGAREVLESLQRLRDAGVPVEDRGGGHLEMPEALVSGVLEGVLPSLKALWSRELASALIGAVEASSVVDRADAPSQRASSVGGEAAAEQRSEPARAGALLEAAGEAERGAAQYLEAALRAEAVSDGDRALGHAAKARALAEHLPPGARGDEARWMAALVSLRLRLHFAARDASFRLDEARDELLSLKAKLVGAPRPDLLAEWASLVAAVAYELGEPDSLDAARAALSEASRSLLSRDEPVLAARLLNDLAALELLQGRAAEAVKLLQESRTVFERFSDQEPLALLEMAETDHLCARLPMHAEGEVTPNLLSLAIDHARHAERAYQRLGAVREAARVRETLGRLELRRGRLEAATELLRDVAREQQAMGDALGLARTAAACAGALVARGEAREALSLLEQSIALNASRGATAGLDYNRDAVEELARQSSDVGLQRGLEQLREQLGQARQALHRS